MSYGLKKIGQLLSVRSGNESIPDNDICLSDEAFFKFYLESKKTEKPSRISNGELRNLYNSNVKLSKEQKLVKSVLDDCSVSKIIYDQAFKNAQELYEFRRKYKSYLRIKRFIPLSLVAPLTGSELTKMAYATAIG